MLDRIVFNAKANEEGVLRVDVTLGPSEAAREVKVTIEPSTSISEEEWRRGVLALAGKWDGDFERPPQGEYEEREGFDQPSP